MLTERQRRFADAWNGSGTGAEAARAAGYQGAHKSLKVCASRLLRHPAVRARIEERLGPVAKVEAPSEPELAAPSEWSKAQRLEVLRAIATDPKTAARDRVAAVREAARIAGDLDRPHRSRALPPAPAPKVPDVTAPAGRDGGKAPRARIELVLSAKDRAPNEGQAA